MGKVRDSLGQLIARYLQKPVRGYEPFTPSDPDALRQSLAPGDVLLVEGNNHISGVIKYLTQSTWSHSALYVGPIEGQSTADGEPHVLIEANVGEGVVSAPLSKYFRFHTRICRPVGLTADDCSTVCAYAIARVGLGYDVKNITDLLRYLLAAAGAAALAAAHDRARLGRSVAAHLLGADRGRIHRRALSDPAKNHAGAQPAGAGADFGDPPLFAVLPARLRHLALFQRGQADHPAGIQLQGAAMGRSAPCARG